MEYENHYASNGKGNLGVTLGAIGTGLGVLSGGLGNIGGILGGGVRSVNGCGCSEDHFVNRYEAGKDAEISSLRTQIMLRDANTYADQKLLEVYRYVDGKFACVEGQIAQQAVYNATNTSTIACLQGQVAQLQSLTKIIVPSSSICPEPMSRYNSWTAPTETAAAAG